MKKKIKQLRKVNEIGFITWSPRSQQLFQTCSSGTDWTAQKQTLFIKT